jgi:membrane-associated HD superfamily phosphohydrolase
MEDFIAGHHGTSLIRFFHEKAKYQAEVSGEDPTRVPEGQFRYPGPKPQSREAAVVAIADHVEASSRARLEGKQTPATIRRFVRGIIREKRDDGQFDECDLTTRDLALVEDAITRVLSSMFHHRVKYPESGDTKKAKQAAFEKELHKQERAAAKTKEKMLTQ